MAETVKTRYSFPLPILLLEDSSISFLKSNIPSEGVTAGGWGATKCLLALPTCALDLARWSQLSSQKLPGGFNSGFSYSPVRMSYLSSSSESCQLFPGSVFTATQEARLTDCRFVKCACTSPFSKLLGTSEKSQIEHTHDWESMGVTEFYGWLATSILMASVLFDKCSSLNLSFLIH